jgi:DNA-binding transcriptional MerR regulator
VSAPEPDEETYSLAEVAEHTGVPGRTIRYYQSEGILPRPRRSGREAIYGAEHVERLELIIELRDRGLTLGAIKDLVTAHHPSRTVAQWLGIDATLTVPWSQDRLRVMTRDELRELIGPTRRGLLADLQEAGFIRPDESGMWMVPSPALLDLALTLQDAGIDVEISGKLRDLLSERLAKAVDEAVKLIVERVGAGFAGRASADELATALGALRPVAREMTGLILAQHVERALAELVNLGPMAVRRAARKRLREASADLPAGDRRADRNRRPQAGRP